MCTVTRDQSRRTGAALPLVIVAMVVLSALVAGAFMAATQQSHIAGNGLRQVRALSAAEFGQDSIYSGWDRRWNSSSVNTTFLTTGLASGDGSSTTVRVTRLNQLSFLVVSEGSAGRGLRTNTRRRTALLLRMQIPLIKTLGALTSRGTVRIGGSTSINGRDTSLAGWGCPPAGAATAGVAVPSTSNLTIGGTCSGFTCLQGSPLVSVTPQAADTSTYFSYGGPSWSSLTASADKVVSGLLVGVQPSYSAGSCNTADLRNWGDPTRASTPGACESYFPVIYAPGDLAINGNMGQGILLVGGNLSVQGNFSFYGPVIARGTVKFTGTGNHVVGSVMAASVIDSTATSVVSGNSTIRYSRCAMNAALAGSATPVRAPQRSWAELF